MRALSALAVAPLAAALSLADCGGLAYPTDCYVEKSTTVRAHCSTGQGHVRAWVKEERYGIIYRVVGPWVSPGNTSYVRINGLAWDWGCDKLASDGKTVWTEAPCVDDG